MNLAVGFFDGVHLGHQRIIERADAVLTFTNHPATVYAPERAPSLLMTTEERIRALAAEGARRVEAREFTSALAAQQPSDFADSLRRDFPGLDTVFCGANWTFGAGGVGTPDFLRGMGFHVEVVPFESWRGERISSTRIRAALGEGDVAAASAMLGRPYAASGRIVQGKGAGRKLGFPTLNVAPALGDLPLARGVYAVDTPLGCGVANWGVAPTMGDNAWKEPVLEVHLLSTPPEPPPAALSVSFTAFIRPERTFATIEELKAQIANFDERLAGLDNLLADGLTDEAVHRYARELSKIIDEREPVLNEIRQWLMLLDKPADGEPLPN